MLRLKRWQWVVLNLAYCVLQHPLPCQSCGDKSLHAFLRRIQALVLETFSFLDFDIAVRVWKDVFCF